MITEEFNTGDVFYVPLYSTTYYNGVVEYNYKGHEDNITIRITAHAIFMIKNEKEIKSGKEFTIKELIPIAKELRRLEKEGYVHNGPALRIWKFEDGYTLIPIQLVSKDKEVAKRMQRQLLNFRNVYNSTFLN